MYHQQGYNQPQLVRQEVPPKKANEFTFIRNGSNDLVLDVAGEKNKPGAKVITYHAKNPPAQNQLWKIEPVDDKRFFIVSALNSSLVLDIDGESTKPGTNVIVYTKKHPPAPNQLWEWQGQLLHSAMGHDLVMDVKSEKPETHVTVETRKMTPHQNWKAAI